MNAQQISAVKSACDCILDAAEMAGPYGIPSGTVYLALSAYGLKLHVYQQLLDVLVTAGRISVKNDLIVRIS